MPDPTRRHALEILAAAALVGCQAEPPNTTPADTDDDGTPDACPTPTYQQTAGPFYPGEPAARVDIAPGLDGVVFDVDLLIVAVGTCDPVVGAEVDLWGADAGGAYSGYADFGTQGEDWMRGQQVTDDEGRVRFRAIVPGSYPGRAVHLHVKVRPADGGELTTQIYLPDADVAAVLALPAYADGAAQTTNAADGFYRGDTLVTVSGTPEAGLEGEVTLVI